MKSKTKKLTSLLLALTLIIGVMSIAPFSVSAASYKDNFINALLDQESKWLNIGDEAGFYFYDLNFDGKPEMIVKYMSSCSASNIYYYENNTIKLAKHQYKNNTGQIVSDNHNVQISSAHIQNDAYYNPNENKYVVHSGYFSQYGNRTYFANGELTFNGNTATTYCYALQIIGDTKSYYDGSNGYENTQYANKITESQYNSIIKNRFNNYTNLNVKFKEISRSNWNNYTYSQKKKALESSYNAFICAPASVKLNKSSITLGVGESYTLTKTVSPSNASTSYTWSSSNTSVATVNSSGKITAKGTGTANITVKTSNGKTATCTVTVKKAPSKVSLNKTSITLGVGETYDLNSSLPSGTASYSVKYSSNKSSVASVKSVGGLVTAKAVGTATITAKTFNGKTATCTVTVKKAPTSVSLNKTSITLGVGETYDLNSKLPSGCASYSVTYSSNKTSVATVKAAGGLVTAKAVGTATITAKTYNGKTATCKVTVKKAPTSVSLNKTSVTLKVGQTYDLNSKLPSGCASYSVKYTSNNTKVATVKASGGLVTAKAKGTATITATTYNGKKATCKVTVK